MRLPLLAATAALSLTASARADLQFCNKTSYVLDLALALAEKDAAATRGWLRVDPGACRTVLQGAITYALTAKSPAIGSPIGSC